MAITPVKDREGWYDVTVWDRVTTVGQRPAKVSRRVEGLRAAEDLERRLKNERDRGSLTERRQTLGAYADRWLSSRRTEVSASTLDGYRRYVNEYVKRHDIGNMKVGEVDVTAVSNFYADVLERGSVGKPVAVATVAGIHRVLSMILKRAVVDGLLYVNPCTVARPPKDDSVDEEDDERGIDPEDARQLLTVIEDVAPPAMYHLAAVALGTGLRRSELVGLKWPDVDLERGELIVRAKIEQVGGKVERRSPKTKRSRRTVPFGPRVNAMLRRQRRLIDEKRLRHSADGLWVDEGYVFPAMKVSFQRNGQRQPAGRVWSPNAVAQQWRYTIDRVNERRLGEWVAAGHEVADFEPLVLGIHDLRHAYATAQLAAGVRDELVSRRMGHSSSLITRRVYSHVLEDEKRDGLDVVDSLI